LPRAMPRVEVVTPGAQAQIVTEEAARGAGLP